MPPGGAAYGSVTSSSWTAWSSPGRARSESSATPSGSRRAAAAPRPTAGEPGHLRRQSQCPPEHGLLPAGLRRRGQGVSRDRGRACLRRRHDHVHDSAAPSTSTSSWPRTCSATSSPTWLPGPWAVSVWRLRPTWATSTASSNHLTGRRRTSRARGSPTRWPRSSRRP